MTDMNNEIAATDRARVDVQTTAAEASKLARHREAMESNLPANRSGIASAEDEAFRARLAKAPLRTCARELNKSRILLLLSVPLSIFALAVLTGWDLPGREFDLFTLLARVVVLVYVAMVLTLERMKRWRVLVDVAIATTVLGVALQLGQLARSLAA